MNQRGRKSAASFETPALIGLNPRPKAPGHLTIVEASIWTDLVSSLRPDFFTKADYDTLANACRHLSSVREISEWVRRSMAEDGDLAEVDRMLKMRSRETAAANSCLRALRLTKQARMEPRTAGRAIDNSGQKLWE